MGDNKLSEDHPFYESFDDAVSRHMHNANQSLSSISRQLDDLHNAVEVNTVNIEILQEAIQTIAVIPNQKVNLRYAHKENKLWINERFYMKFDGREADVFRRLFKVEGGMPKNSRIQIGDVAEKISDKHSTEKVTPKAVHQAIKRVEAKLNKHYATKDLLTISTKEFYISRK